MPIRHWGPARSVDRVLGRSLPPSSRLRPGKDRLLQPGEIQERAGDVGLDDRLALPAAGFHAGSGQDQRNVQRVGPQLQVREPGAVIAQHLAVVSGEGDERLAQARLSEKSPQLAIEVADLGPVLARGTPGHAARPDRWAACAAGARVEAAPRRRGRARMGSTSGRTRWEARKVRARRRCAARRTAGDPRRRVARRRGSRSASRRPVVRRAPGHAVETLCQPGATRAEMLERDDRERREAGA